MAPEDRQAFIEETEANIQLYQQMVSTDNEVLNTILAEKILYCNSHQIQLNYVVDSVPLAFISIADLYALLDNAIDNAIESVSRLENPERRVIGLTIQNRNAFISIQTNNYYDGKLEFQEGLPVTTKSVRLRHGYGLKSIRYLSQKYGGSMCVSAQDSVFTLQIMLPVSQ